MMPFLAAGGGVIFAFQNSDLAGKIIVFILIISSIFSWSIMITKIQFIRKCRKQNALFLQAFERSKRPLDIFKSKRRFLPSSVESVYYEGCRELCLQLMGSTDIDETFEARLSVADSLGSGAMNSVQSAMERAVGEQMLTLESHLTLLATAVSGSPFLGLLGTVWGVMDAFSGVALAGSANLSAMAPGVSGALLTTVCGLVVAIPAMFGYNFMVNTVKTMTVEMENFTAQCASVIERKYGRK